MISALKNIFSMKNLKNTFGKYYKKNIRENKLKINDIIAYQLLYSSIDTTKKFSSKSVNYDTNKSVSCNAYYEQSKKYSLSFYKDILQQLNESYNKYTDKPNSNDFIIRNRLNNSFIDENLMDSLNDSVILLVDGTCSNSYYEHKLRTTNTLFMYDYTHSTCIDSYTKRKIYTKTKKSKELKNKKTTKTGKQRKKYTSSNKNNEVNMFMDYIKINYKKLQNMYKNKTIIFVCDRAYHSYKLFHLLDSCEFKYIIRIKDNNLIVNDNKTKNKEVLHFRKNARCVTCDVPLIIEYTDSCTLKKRKCSIISKYHIITNLLDKKIFNDKIIEKIYHIRWNIEIFFKFSKNNTKMDFFKEKKANNHKIMRTCISIVNILLKFLIHIYMNSKTFKKKIKIF
jgi:hypothetical protein